MDKYVAGYTFFIIMISFIIYLLIGAMLEFGLSSLWYSNLLKSGLEITINRYVFVFLYFFTILLPYTVLYDKPLVLLYLLIGALLSLLWIVIFFVGQDISLSIWLIVPVFLYYLWLFSNIWIYYPLGAIFLLPLLVFIIFIFYHTVHLAFINNIIL